MKIEENNMQDEINILTRELADAKKYIIDINKFWKFKVEQLEISNKSLLKQIPELYAKIAEQQTTIDSLIKII